MGKKNITIKDYAIIRLKMFSMISHSLGGYVFFLWLVVSYSFRSGELASIRKSNFTADKTTFYLYGKNSRLHVFRVPLSIHESVLRALHSPFWRPCSARSFQRWTKRVFCLTPHQIRTLEAQYRYSQGESVYSLQDYLRHIHLATTFYYLQRPLISHVLNSFS